MSGAANACQCYVSVYPCVAEGVRTDGRAGTRAGTKGGRGAWETEDGDIERRAVAMIETETQTTPDTGTDMSTGDSDMCT